MPFTKYPLLNQSYFFTPFPAIAHMKFTNHSPTIFYDYHPQSCLKKHFFRSRANRRLVCCLSLSRDRVAAVLKRAEDAGRRAVYQSQPRVPGLEHWLWSFWGSGSRVFSIFHFRFGDGHIYYTHVDVDVFVAFACLFGRDDMRQLCRLMDAWGVWPLSFPWVQVCRRISSMIPWAVLSSCENISWPLTSCEGWGPAWPSGILSGRPMRNTCRPWTGSWPKWPRLGLFWHRPVRYDLLGHVMLAWKMQGQTAGVQSPLWRMQPDAKLQVCHLKAGLKPRPSQRIQSPAWWNCGRCRVFRAVWGRNALVAWAAWRPRISSCASHVQPSMSSIRSASSNGCVQRKVGALALCAALGQGLSRSHHLTLRVMTSYDPFLAQRCIGRKADGCPWHLTHDVEMRWEDISVGDFPGSLLPDVEAASESVPWIQQRTFDKSGTWGVLAEDNSGGTGEVV